MTVDSARIPFSEEDERCIVGAARWGTIVGWTTIASAVVTILVSAWTGTLFGTESLVNVPFAAVEIVLSVWLLQACQSFRNVALTDEADQAHLLNGFRKLRAYIMGQVLTIVLTVGFVFVGGLFFFSLFASSF